MASGGEGGGGHREGGGGAGGRARAHHGWLSLSAGRPWNHRPRVPCPTRRCRCFRKHRALHLKCSSHPEPLERIPYFRPYNITFESVALANHNFSRVPDDAFRNVRVAHLDLHGNRFDEGLGARAFRGQERSLRVLDLGGCGLHDVPTRALWGLASLTVLRLNDNRIQRLRRNAFRHNAQLQDLALYRNQISVVDPGSFSGLSNLRNLKLFRNEMAQVSSRMLRRLVQLTSLDLSWNGVTSVHAGALRTLRRLTWLDLGYNRLWTLSTRTFRGLKRLKYLNLEHNALERIQDGSFRPVRKLKYLSLDVNATRVTNATFAGLHKLQHLYLGDVNRTRLPGAVFTDLARLKFLSFSDYSGAFEGLEPGMFAPGLRLETLSVWAVPVHGCTCSRPWILRLVRSGVFLHGYCADGTPISCRRRRRRTRPLVGGDKGRAAPAKGQRRKISTDNGERENTLTNQVQNSSR